MIMYERPAAGQTSCFVGIYFHRSIIYTQKDRFPIKKCLRLRRWASRCAIGGLSKEQIHTFESDFQISANLLNFGFAFRSVISVCIWIAHTAMYGHLQYMSERLRRVGKTLWNWHTECPYTNSYALNALNAAYARDFTYEKMIQGFDPRSNI